MSTVVLFCPFHPETCHRGDPGACSIQFLFSGVKASVPRHSTRYAPWCFISAPSCLHAIPRLSKKQGGVQSQAVSDYNTALNFTISLLTVLLKKLRIPASDSYCISSDRPVVVHDTFHLTHDG